MPKLVPAATLKLPPPAPSGGARRVERRGRGQRAAVERQRARQGAHVAVLRDLQRAAVDGRAAGVGIDPRQHQRAQVGLDQLGRAVEHGRDGGRIAGAIGRARAHPDDGLVGTAAARGRAGQGQLVAGGIALQHIAIGGELHALYVDRSVSRAVDPHRAALAGEGEGALAPGRIDRAGSIGPVVVDAARRHPGARAAVDLVVVLRAGIAIPIVQRQAIGVGQVDLLVHRGLDEVVGGVGASRQRTQRQARGLDSVPP